jgi:hypothetical protein
MIGEDIKLVGQFIDYETGHKDWWSEYQKGQQFALQIKKKNAQPLKEIYKKMYDDGIHYLRLHFEGGHDEGGFDDNFQYLDCDKIDMDIKDISKYEPTGWIITYIPLIHETKIKKQNITQVFEYPKTDYSNFKLTDNWLREKWYDFGFLEEWGSFAFEGHVSGDVTVSTKDGTYEIDAEESHEQWESKSNSGTMFMEK